MNEQKDKTKKRLRKARHIRRVLRNNPVRLRLSIFRSQVQVYGQIIDDLAGVTLCAASSLDRDLREECRGLKRTDAAVRVGEALGRRAREKGISKVKFDRGWHRYHGRVKALAEAARKAGLEF